MANKGKYNSASNGKNGHRLKLLLKIYFEGVKNSHMQIRMHKLLRQKMFEEIDGFLVFK